MTKKVSIGWMFIKGLAIFFATLLLFAFFATYVNPAKFVWFAYFGMIFPILLVINILFVVFLAFNLKKTALISLATILLNWANIQTLMTFQSAEFDTNEKKIKVLSYNVNLFDYYGKINPKEKQTEQEILDLIVEESPDIVCFQEFREDSKQASVTRFLAQNAGLNYKSVSRYNDRIAFGNKIYTKFKIIHDSLIRFENSKNMIVFADVLAYEDTIRVFNFHLESIGFQKADDLFYKDLTTIPSETSDIKKGVWRLISKMNTAYAKRSEQSKILAQLITDSPYRTLVCGDMNDTPASYTYRQISRTMNDSFCERALGLGTSYNGAYPSFRIDYIFFSEGLYCENFTTIRANNSDHFPIYSDLKISDL